MLISLATLALLTFSIGIGAWGATLLRQRGRRLIGIVLLAQAMLAATLQVLLSVLPFGIGEPLIRVPLANDLLQALGALLATIGVAALLYAGGRGLLARVAPRSPRLAIAGALLVVPLVAGAGLAGLVGASTPARERERDARKRQITLAPDFAAEIYAEGTIDNPTSITFGPDNNLYIADISGTLWKARDQDKNNVIDAITPWASGFELLVGLVWHNGELFAASSGKIEALRDADNDGKADQRRVVVRGLPSMILRPHSNNGLAFGPDGRLYFGVGSTTSGEVESNPLAAGILSVNPDGSDLRTFARGMGNSFDVAFNPEGELFGGDNSPGGPDDPPDEFNHIVEGGHYGYPYFYGDPPKNSTIGALATFPAHASPTGVTFYTGGTYPATYRDNAFITLWNRGEVARVEVARTSGGNYLSRTSTFGSGFLYPIDAVVGPDGNLYIADFGTSVVYRIRYKG